MHFTDQRDYAVRFETGQQGLLALLHGEVSHVVIIDVLSFSTCVDVAVARGAEIIPYRWRDETAQEFARSRAALLAGGPDSPYSLVAESLATVPRGTRLVLPSPNGSTLAHMAAERAQVIAGCLRNAAAVSAFLREQEGPVAIIAAGERWGDGTLRASLEDLLGAGAIIDGLEGTRSPEAEAAGALYRTLAPRIPELLHACSSGRELIEKGHPGNVALAAELNVSSCVPLQQDGRFAPAYRAKEAVR